MTGLHRFGPVVEHDGVTFRLWAPAAKQVELVTTARQRMQPRAGGWFEWRDAAAHAGTRYQFRIDDDIELPDPGSRFQPDDVHSASEVIAPDYDWRVNDWKGRPWHETVLLETHVGAFTPEGTYRAVIDKLDHIVETGFTALQLMPLADAPGRWNWGYDGVLPFATNAAYGRPEDLKALVDAAHGRGLMVFLDVVYNHFGPEGNYLGRIAPSFFTAAETPWGTAIDYRVREVRDFVIENVLSWLEDYRFDGLRFDAVHAIVERGSPPLLVEISERVGELARRSGRHIHLVLENDDNESALLDPITDPPDGRYRAQWNDDYHHAWHVLLTSETADYYRDFERAGDLVARTLAEGFAYQGEPSPHRGGASRGQPSKHLPAAAFVHFLQNHDQIGNRAYGERLDRLTTPEAVEAALVITLLGPATPMLFMGEEWGAPEPFPYFCDFEGELAEAIRSGRKKEFADAYAAAVEALPDPMAEETVRLATLDWNSRSKGGHARRLAHVRQLLALRRTHLMPLLPAIVAGAGRADFDNGLLTARWPFRDGKTLSMLANLSDHERDHDTAVDRGAWIWGGVPAASLAPWAVHVALEHP